MKGRVHVQYPACRSELGTVVEPRENDNGWYNVTLLDDDPKSKTFGKDNWYTNRINETWMEAL